MITLHIEASDRHFAGYLERDCHAVPLSEEDFQILIETLAGTASTADRILSRFMTRPPTKIEAAE